MKDHDRLLNETQAEIYAAMTEHDGVSLSEDARADIYAAMAEDEDEAEDARHYAKPLISGGAVNLTGKTVQVQVGDKMVEVATGAYVRRLEQIVQEQDRAMKRQERLLRALGALVRQQRTAANHHATKINDVQRSLDNKIDRRDF